MNGQNSRKPHPLAELFPLMVGNDYDVLKADIAANGLDMPIMLLDGMILDGRNRYRACVETGVEPKFRQYEGNDPARFVASANLHRRHLSISQRALIASRLADLKHGGNRSKAQNCGLSRAEAAERFKVSPRLADGASALRKAVKAGELPVDLLDRVSAGEVTVSKAMRDLKAARLRNAAQGAKWSRVANERAVQVAGFRRRVEGVVLDVAEPDAASAEFKTSVAQICNGAAVRFREMAEVLERSDRPRMPCEEV